MERLRIGVIGCGMISEKYLENLTKTFAFCLDVRAVADIVPEAAQKRAEQFGVPVACSPDELLADPEIELVVNLTIPAAHYDVSLKALEAGKHVYTEKPLAVTRAEGETLLATAAAKGLRIGGARIPSWAAACRPAARSSTTAGSAPRSRRWGSPAWASPWPATTPWASAPCSTWAPTISPPWSTCWAGQARLRLGADAVRGQGGQQPRSPWFGAEWKVETPLVVAATLDFAKGVNATLTATCEPLWL
jgi:hypothetical protein